MKKVCVNILISTGILFLCLFCACSNSYDEMITDYNKKFFTEKPADKRVYSLDGNDFDQTEMLADSYELKKGMTFSLTAPEGGVTYSWVAIVPDVEDKKKENETEICKEKDLMCRVSDFFRFDVVNKLLLTVTDEKGNSYKDTAFIIIE